MNKKNKILYVGVIYSIVIIYLLSSVYIRTEYNLSINEYIKKSSPITKEEKEYLNNYGNIIYGSDQSSPPLRFKESGDNQYRGIIVDLINSLSLKLGQEIEFKPSEWWQESLDNLSTNNIDIFDLIKSNERQSKFSFTDPIYTLRGNLLKHKDTDINEINDLSKKTIAIPKGDYAIEFINKKLIDTHIKQVDDIKSGIDLLINNEVDAVIGDDPVIYYYLNEMNMSDDYEKLDYPLYIEEVVLAVKKGNEVLIDILNKAIFQLQKSGVNDEIKSKWNFYTEDINYIFVDSKSSGGQEYVLTGFILISVYISYSYAYLLKREIEVKTSELEKSREELKITYNQMLRDNKLAAIGQLASGIAHEIRNPLGIIRNYCYLLKDEVNDMEEVSTYIKSIEGNVERASNIVSNLLNFSRISNEKYKSRYIKEFLENMIVLENKNISLKGIKVCINCDEDIKADINEESLQHVFLNLISNSIHAISYGGSIYINVYTELDTLYISFEDDGIGIKYEDLDNIFNPFFTTKESKDGTGLGLYIVFNEIKKQGGNIVVKSEINKGTKFIINLPTKRGEMNIEDFNC